MVKDPFAGSGTGIVDATLRSFPKYAHTYVAESCAKHGAMSLDVESPPTIFILYILLLLLLLSLFIFYVLLIYISPSHTNKTCTMQGRSQEIISRGAKCIEFKDFVAYTVIRPKSKYYIIFKYLTSYTSKIKITYLVTIFSALARGSNNIRQLSNNIKECRNLCLIFGNNYKC